MKVLVEGELFSVFQKPDYKDRETGEVSIGKPVLQLMIASELRNGEIKNELFDITVPQEKMEAYREKQGEMIQVPCNMFVKGELTLYGV